MAAYHSRLVQAIRSIVLGVIKDRRSDPLTTQQIRDAIAGRRGIGYMFPDGINAGNVSGTSGVTLLGAGLGNLSQFATDKDIDDVVKKMDNQVKSITNVLNIQVGKKAMGIDELMDCETGKELEIINTPKFKPPPGWDDEDTPSATNPIRWDLGFRYVALTSGPGGFTYGETAQEVADNIPSHMDGGPWVFNGFIDPASIGSTAPFAANYQGPMSGSASFAIDKIPCLIGVESHCPASRAPTHWPADNKMQLARGADGKFRYSTSEAAADIIPAYTDNAHSKLDVCFADGSGRTASIEPTYDGGWMIYETNEDGDPIGVGTDFSSENVALSHWNAADERDSRRMLTGN